MLHFGKKFRFGKIAVNDEEEEDNSREQAHFAPQIIEDRGGNVLPSLDFDDDEPSEAEALPEEMTEQPEQPASGAEEKDDGGLPAPEEAFPSSAREDGESEPTQSAEQPDEQPFTEEKLQFLYTDREDEEEAPAQDLSDARPGEIYVRLRALPECEQVYGLYDGRMLLSCPDDAGGVYLFEENGDYLIAEPGDCKGYLRVLSVEGSFRSKTYKTKDLAYILREKTFPITANVRTKEEYDLAARDGYLPYRQSSDGKSIKMVKPMSLYRMKDTVLRVEFAGGRTVGESEEFVLGFERSLFEESEGSKHFSRICKAALETILKVEQPFFTLQVLKVRKNLVLAFPMDGKPKIGDRFADGCITDLASTDDGTLVLRIGADENAALPLHEGRSARGQHQITIE